MKFNQWMCTTGVGLGVSLLWATPSLADLTDTNTYGLEIKATGQAEGDRDLGTRSGGEVNGVGLDLRPYALFERGNWSAYAMGQAVTATDVIETDPTQNNAAAQNNSDTTRNALKESRNYLELREAWIGYTGLFTPYPGEQLRLGLQRLRNDDSEWADTDIEALNWNFDTTLLRSHLGVAERFSQYRTDLTELDPVDKDRVHLYGDIYTQWQPGQWIGLRAHYTHDDGNLAKTGEQVDQLDKTSNGNLTWLGIDANSDAFDPHSLNQFNYWASLTWLTGHRDSVETTSVNDVDVVSGTEHGNVNAWATDIGVRMHLNEQWQVGGAYARASGGGGAAGTNNYQQDGLQSNRSSFTGTMSRINRFGEAYRAELDNIQVASLFGSWQLQQDYDASLIYHQFWRVNTNQRIGSNGIDAAVDADGDVNTLALAPLKDGEKDLGQEMDLVVTKYFKEGLLPASMSQSFDDPSALVRLRGGVFKPGNAYGNGVDATEHRVFLDVIWRI